MQGLLSCGVISVLNHLRLRLNCSFLRLFQGEASDMFCFSFSLRGVLLEYALFYGFVGYFLFPDRESAYRLVNGVICRGRLISFYIWIKT